MAYVPQTWTNGPAGGTPLSAARMGVIEAGLVAAAAAADGAGSAIPLTQKGAASGVATLDAGGLMPRAQVTHPPIAHATKTVGQTTNATAGDATIILFDAETFDTDNMHSTSVNTSRLTSVLAGYYRITGKGSVSSAPAYLMVGLAKNGVGVPEFNTTTGSPTGAYAQVILSTLIFLAVGDYVELLLFCSTASAGVYEPSCFLEAQFVRP